MLPRSASARHAPVVDIGVGIDTSRYGHYVAFLSADLHTAAADLEVIESTAGYTRLRQRLVDLVARHGQVHFHVRLDAAGLYADNLLAWLGALDLDGAAFTVSCGDTQRNKNYRVASMVTGRSLSPMGQETVGFIIPGPPAEQDAAA